MGGGSTPVFVGIDVACGKGKSLPICFVDGAHPLRLLALPDTIAKAIPRGPGNGEVLAAAPFRDHANRLRDVLAQIEEAMGWTIKAIAIDAPAAPPQTGGRRCEAELAKEGLSSFKTPALDHWPQIREECRLHLEAGGALSRLPNANRVWMLYGFELFSCLRGALAAEVIEVYPFAIVHGLLPSCSHKSTEEGYRDQLSALAARTGWESAGLEAALRASVPGSRHDRLDAYMAAWVASLPAGQRRAYGDASNPDDSIWTPA